MIDTADLSAAEALTIQEARAAACGVIASREFADLMAGEKLRETCDSLSTVSGTEVRDLLLNRLPDHHVRAGKPFRAEAATNTVTRRIKIRHRRFEHWAAKGAEQSEMLNTLVHEWTHLFPGPDGYARFQDKGHGVTSCPDSSLVSYRTGDLAAEAWLKTHK